MSKARERLKKIGGGIKKASSVFGQGIVTGAKAVGSGAKAVGSAIERRLMIAGAFILAIMIIPRLL